MCVCMCVCVCLFVCGGQTFFWGGVGCWFKLRLDERGLNLIVGGGEQVWGGFIGV